MTPSDSTTVNLINGFLAPIVYEWFPKIPRMVIYGLLGTATAVVYGWTRREKPALTTADTKTVILEKQNAPPNPIHVAIPMIVGGVIAGLPGLAMGAVGEGLKRAAGAIITGGFAWLSGRFKR